MICSQSCGHLREVATCDVAEGQSRTKCDARARIIAAHDARDIVSDCVEARDRLTITAEHTRVFIGHQTGVCAEIADDHLDRVERSVFDRLHAWIRRVQRIALVTVVGLAALSECRVLALSRMDVDVLYGLFKSCRIDTSLVGEFAQCAALEKIASAKMMTHGKRERSDGTKTIFPQRFVVADEISRDLVLAC